MVNQLYIHSIKNSVFQSISYTVCYSDAQSVLSLCYLTADSTNLENFSHPLGVLVDTCYGNENVTITLPGEVLAASPIAPCPMEMLDSLTVHAKMR